MAKKQSALTKAKTKIQELESQISSYQERYNRHISDINSANQTITELQRDKALREQGNVRRVTDSITHFVETMTGRRIKNLQWEWY